MGSLTKSFEDYLEAIYLLEQEKGAVRVKDVAKSLGVKLPSVTEAVRKMSKARLIEFERYGLIKLTGHGKIFAKEVYKKHKTLFNFLHKILGVNKSIALKDACEMEHGLSNITLNKLRQFMNKRR
ncbi:metal-dependent transcriptional regulator [Candidatus Woesearchaeota archaeon]|nr:metal-dependent transcriptional regulator [Candidatus Woesearchaeota archaeon]